MIKKAPTILFLQCDQCRKDLLAHPFISRTAAPQIRAQAGWIVIGEADFCPECAAKWFACREASRK